MWRWLRPRQRRALLVVVCVVAAMTVVVLARRSSASVSSAANTGTAGGSPPTSLMDATRVSTGATVVATPPGTPITTGGSLDAPGVTTSTVPSWPVAAVSRRQHDGAGARASALQYVSAVQSEAVYAGAPADRTLLTGWLAPSAHAGELDRALEELAAARDVLVKGHGEVWWIASPLAVRLVTVSDERARVDVWLTRVIASGANDGPGVVPAVSWTTSTVDLVWTDDRGWSVESVTDTPGPVPMTQTTAQPATSAEFTVRLAGFELVKEHS